MGTESAKKAEEASGEPERRIGISSKTATSVLEKHETGNSIVNARQQKQQNGSTHQAPDAKTRQQNKHYGGAEQNDQRETKMAKTFTMMMSTTINDKQRPQ